MAKLSTQDKLLLPGRLLWLWVQVMWSYVLVLLRLLLGEEAKSVRGKVVLVTGAASGIGRQVALLLGQHGAKLALWDINKEGVEETVAMVTEQGGQALGYVCDVTSASAVKQVAAEVRSDLDEVDIVVNNAGIFHCKPLMSLTESDIRRCFEVNVLAHYWIVQEFLSGMLARNDGHIVCVASMAGKMGVSLSTDYGGSKFGAVGFMESLAEELRLKKKNIQITTVCPMIVKTNMFEQVSSRILVNDKFGRFLEVEEVAEAIVDGICFNRRYVYIPKHMALAMPCASWMPIRAKNKMKDFLEPYLKEMNPAM